MSGNKLGKWVWVGGGGGGRAGLRMGREGGRGKGREVHEGRVGTATSTHRTPIYTTLTRRPNKPIPRP